MNRPAPPLIKPLHFHFSIRSITKITAMADNSASAGKHISSDWFSVPELRLRDHRFTVPLDYSIDDITSPRITVFVREVVTAGKEELHLPFLLYLQGGPGFECMRPSESSGWISKACEEFRVILMDQRGTGLSTPLTPSSMTQFKSAEELAKYLTHFRAGNIVNDAEFIRKRLVPDSGPWTLLGQSFGGFCATTYLSFAPQGLKQVIMTGGIPPIGSGCTADTVYRACFEQVTRQNEKYYKRFPQDIPIIQEVVKYLAESEGGGVTLPSGGILTPRGLQLLGLAGLGSSTGFERLHYLFERVWDPILVPGAPKRISYSFLNAYERWLDFDTNPLFAIMHETINCQGASSSWSAHRIKAETGSQFDAVKAAKEGRPVLFTGEMVFPWFFDEIHALRPFKEAARLLAEKKDWPPLYDIASLNNNKFPESISFHFPVNQMNHMNQMGRAPFNPGPRHWAPPPWPLLPPPHSSFWTGSNVSSHLKELHDTINLAKAMQKELEMLTRMKESERTTEGHIGDADISIDRFSKFMKENKIELDFQESLSLNAANAVMSKLKYQLEPYRVVTDENSPWEEKSAVKRLADKMEKYKRNKLWRRRKRRRIAQNLAKEREQFDRLDKEADEWRAREMAKDAAQRKVEKMKEIAKVKAKEEKKRLESELELVLIVEKLQELRSIRIEKLKKQGHFFPEEDDKFLERVRAAVEEEERQSMAAADTDAAKDAIANAEESRKHVNSHAPDSEVLGLSNFEHIKNQDQKNETANEKDSKLAATKESRKIDTTGSAYDSVSNLPMEFYHYYHGSNTDMGTLIEVRRTWDAYLRPGGSRIPGHWVQPPPPADEIWASYLVKPK